MANEYGEQRPRVFISYSRVDSEFAYRLRADLEANGFVTWIDTAKLGDEGGQEWIRVIEKAVDSCQAMVVVLSPEAVDSKYVHMEYHRIQTQPGKLLIPLHYRTVTQAHMDLDLTQWIEFRNGKDGPDTYQTGLNKLIRSLAKAPQPPKLAPLPQAPTISTTPQSVNELADRPEFGPVPKAPPEPTPEIQELIAGAFVARGERNLINEEYFLQKIVESDNPQLRASYFERLKAVRALLLEQRIDSLRTLAQGAASEKQWRRALGAWQALLRLQPDDSTALKGVNQARTERATEALRDGEFDDAVGSWQALLRDDPLSSEVQQGLRAALRARADDAWRKADWARAIQSWKTLRSLTPPEADAAKFLSALVQNQSGDHRYQIAQQLLAAGNERGARAALDDLYQVAPSYGDPAGITSKIHYFRPQSILEQEEAALAIAIKWARRQGYETPVRASPLPDAIAQEQNSLAAGFWAILAMLASVFGIGNFAGTAISAVIRAGIWWQGAMFSRGLTLAWMSILAVGVLTVIFGILTTIIGGMMRAMWSTSLTSALALALCLGVPACWCVATYLSSELQHGVDWPTLWIVAGGGVLGMLVEAFLLFLFFLPPNRSAA